MKDNFVHLNLHSEYSIVDGIVKIPALIAKCKTMKMGAIAVTDLDNIFAQIKFYKAALKNGIKPIFGADVTIKTGNEYSILTLICINDLGRLNLIDLVSSSYLQRDETGTACVNSKILTKQKCEGLIAISPGLAGALAKCKDPAKYIAWAKSIFGEHFYLGISRLKMPDEELYIQKACSISKQQQIPLVAIGAVQFLESEDLMAHKARVCIERGSTIASIKDDYKYTQEQYLKSPAEMCELFKDIPEAIINTSRIAMMCNVKIELGKVHLPNFTLADGTDPTEGFEGIVLAKLQQKMGSDIPYEYKERLLEEAKIIKSMGFVGYFLIVADFIEWSCNNNVAVGPGRGSGAGSLVAYVLGITDVDPLKYGLLFERFLNSERVSMPDFDIDFCMLGRDSVIRYVTEKYGRDNVSQIITYGTMAAKAVIRDVGRVLGYPYGFVDNIAKLIPFAIGMTLERALAEEPKLAELRQQDTEVASLMQLAMKLEGLVRNVGKHAGGVIIAPKPLTNYTALYQDPSNEGIISQFDKDDIEEIGLVKFDFLGLRTLTIIDWAIANVNKIAKDKNMTIADIADDDEATFKMLQRCETAGVFQLESRGMQDLVKRLEPNCFEDIVALIALFRPGPLQSGMVDDFIECKHGRAEIVYLHPLLETVLKPTYGVILYQEQVMEIARVLAGYSLGGADLLRRAMGKKKPAEMAKQRSIFIEGAKKNDIDEKVAIEIFDLIDKFSGYGFNKSHSVAYAVISYRTAYLKTHHKLEFLAAVLSSDMDNTDKVWMFIEDARSLGITVLPPDLRFSKNEFVVEDGAIRYGLGAIKGLGENINLAMIKEREAGGEYSNLLDLVLRLNHAKINKRTLEALINGHALEYWQIDKAHLLLSIESAIARSDQILQDKNTGQSDLFGTAEVTQHTFNYVTSAPVMRASLKFKYEKEVLGNYLHGHPFHRYSNELQKLGVTSIADMPKDLDEAVYIAGYVTKIRVLITKRKKKFAFLNLEDGNGSIDVAVFADAYEEYAHHIAKDAVLLVHGMLVADDYSGRKVVADRIETIEGMREKRLKYLLIHASEHKDFASGLQQVLKRHSNGTKKIKIRYTNPKNDSAILALPDKWNVDIDDDVVDDIAELAGVSDCELMY